MTRLFGTDGIRGEAGRPPLDDATVRALGRALGEVLSEDLHHPPRIVVGRDTRESGPRLLRHLAAGLTEVGASVRSAGVLPTPGVSCLARSDDFDAGIVLSASHNPYRDNGIKVFSARGTKLPDELERAVEERLAPCPETSVGEPPPDEASLAARHADWLVERTRATGVDLGGLSVWVDCAHGAGCGVARDVLSRLGLDLRTLNDRPDGRNINADCGSLHPEALGRAVRESGAELGVALDGDADRALLVDGTGELVDGDGILLVMADALRAEDRLRGAGVVGTVMSNYGLELALEQRGLSLIRERVGDRFVLERMMRDGYGLGGEPSGHVIFLDEAPTGDGLLTALQVLCVVRRSGRSLRDLAAALQRVPQRLLNVRVRERRPFEEIDGYASLAETWSRKLEGRGRILVRYSGTEPLVRVMAEGTEAAAVEACANELADCLRRALGEPEDA